MSNATAAEAKSGHNLGPLTAPSEEQITASLKSQYPQVEKDLADMLEAAKTYPMEITEDDQASALQALIKKMKQARSSWKSWRGDEKKPWDGVAKIVYNFFVTPEEKIEKVQDELNERLTKFSNVKAEKNRIAAELAAEQERERAKEYQRQADEAAMTRLMHEAYAELAEFDERKARERAAELAEDQMWAEARAMLAEWEERQITKRKAAADKIEREKNEAHMKDVARLMKQAQRLHDEATEAGEEVTDDTIQQIDVLIRPGGSISSFATPVQASALLDNDQRATMDAHRVAIGNFRAANDLRMGAAGARKRAKAQRDEEVRLKDVAEERIWRDAYAELELHDRRKATEAAQAHAETAKETTQVAKETVRGHVRAGAEASQQAKGAAREEKSLGRQAERADSHATRSEARAESMSDADASRHRGDHGTTSSLRGRWTQEITDYSALPMIELWNLISDDEKAIAVGKWRLVHQAAWEDREIVRDAMPGVTFIWDTKTQV